MESCTSMACTPALYRVDAYGVNLGWVNRVGTVSAARLEGMMACVTQLRDRFGTPTGYTAGDEVLVKIREVLKSTCRESDTKA